MQKLNNTILIYPYNYRQFAIVKKLIDTYDRVIVASFSGSGLIGKDVSYAVNRKALGIKVVSYEKEILNNVQKLILLNIESDNLEIEEELGRVHRDALEYKLEIETTMKKYTTPSFNRDREVIAYLPEFSSIFFNINIPVIMIGGVVDIIDNEYIAMELSSLFTDEGYRCSTIINNANAELINMNPFPEIFLSEYGSLEYKIAYLNQYIKGICLVEKPEILIIQIPHGIMRYNDAFFNTFGIYSYMVSEAVSCDYFILSIPYSDLDSKEISQIIPHLQRKFNFPIETLHVSNCKYEYDEFMVLSKGSQITFQIDDVVKTSIRNLKESLTIKVIDMFSDESKLSVFYDIIGKLG